MTFARNALFLFIPSIICWLVCFPGAQNRSMPGKRPLPGKRPCTAFQGANVAASIQTYGILIPGKRPCGPKSRVTFKRPWALTWDTTVMYSV